MAGAYSWMAIVAHVSLTGEAPALLVPGSLPTGPHLEGPPTPDKAWLRGAARGMVSLVLRQGVIKCAGIVGSVLLTRILFPQDFGVYAAISTVVGLLAFATDVGLGGALIQQTAEPSEEDMQAVFTFQMLLVLGGIVAIVLAAPTATHILGLREGSEWLIRLLSLLLVVDSFRTLSAVLLRRRLQYARLAVADAVSAVIFQISAVALAFVGAGTWALVVAAVLSYTVAAAMIQYFAPWRIGLRWDWPRIRRHMRFGLPYQGSVALAEMEVASGPLLASALAGPQAAGYVFLTMLIVNLPLAIPQLVSEIAFPTMARLQSSPTEFATATRLMGKINAYTTGLPYLLLLLFGHQIVSIVFGPRWTDTVSLMVLMIWSWIIRISVASTLAALTARGESRMVFWFHLWTAVATWAIAVVAVPRIGYVGIGWASLLAATPLPLVLLTARKSLQVNLVIAVCIPVLPVCLTSAIGGMVIAVAHPFDGGGVAFVSGIVAAAGTYAAAVAVIERASLRKIRIRARALLARRTSTAR